MQRDHNICTYTHKYNEQVRRASRPCSKTGQTSIYNICTYTHKYKCRYAELAGLAVKLVKRVCNVVIIYAHTRINSMSRYAELAGLAVQLVKRGGTVVLASCSSRVSREDFFNACQEAAREQGRPLADIIQVYVYVCV